MALTITKLLLFSFLVSSTVLTAKSELRTSKHEKLTRFRLYVQDKIGGSNATVVTVAQASTTKQSATSFGLVDVFDDALTMDPEMSSKNMGRVQGIEVVASRSEVALAMSANFVFTEGKYKGSSLTAVGRFTPLKVTELPIVGGTGRFRLARGYVQGSTYSLDLKNELRVIVVDFFVCHY